MEDPQVAQKAPFEVELRAGKKYAWCACGRSEKQPFCDGSHSGTSFLPVVFTAETTETAYLCGCKYTASEPFCDGMHGTL